MWSYFSLSGQTHWYATFLHIQLQPYFKIDALLQGKSDTLMQLFDVFQSPLRHLKPKVGLNTTLDSRLYY